MNKSSTRVPCRKAASETCALGSVGTGCRATIRGPARQMRLVSVGNSSLRKSPRDTGGRISGGCRRGRFRGFESPGFRLLNNVII